MTTPDTPHDPRLDLLERWLAAALGATPSRVEPASADASFRRYFRVWQDGRSAIAMDAPPGREDLRPYLQVAGILAAAGVNVPGVLAQDLQQGFLLLTDLGHRQYLDALRDGDDPDRLYGDAIDALVRMQSRTRDTAASLPRYDEARLLQEMDLFPQWFVCRHLGLQWREGEPELLQRSFALLARSALAQPALLVHRDYHSRNLMVCADHNPGVLDFQDAVVGPQAYDLVSLLKDCYIAWPRERLLGWVRRYLAATKEAGIAPPGSFDDFVRAFDLMGLQRHLKVLGIFARLWYRDGKAGYLADLPRVLDYALAVTAAEPALEALDGFLRERVLPAFADAQARAQAAP